MKAIFLSKYSLINKSLTGGQLAAGRNFEILQKYFGEENVKWICGCESGKTHISNLTQTLFGGYYEPEKRAMREIEQCINNGYSVIFWDDSYGGSALKYLKTKHKQLIVIKFFHDFDTIRLKERAKQCKKFALKGECQFKWNKLIKQVHKGNKIAVEYSDRLVTLTQRDSNLFKEHYGRKADFLMPISIKDYRDESLEDKNLFLPISLLFVGVLTYSPNYEGLKEIKKVIKDTNANLYIIGNAEKCKHEFEAENIFFLGEQTDLKKYYYNADAVIAPIFSGGGMKVKVCEALSYGKWIFGTPEAFVGYEVDGRVGGICNTAEEFRDKINEFFSKPQPKFNEYSYQVFKEKYTDDAVYQTFKENIDRLIENKPEVSV